MELTKVTNIVGESIEVMGPYTAILVGQCCVCHEYLYIKDGLGSFGISHGYCEKCMAKLKSSVSNDRVDKS
jgi:hypothetical protein